MEENSVTSAKKEKQSTKKTKKVNPAQLLEIQTQMFYELEVEGFEIDVVGDKTNHTVSITIHGIDFVDGVLVLAKE